MAKSTSWCRASSPDDCDFPAGCSACAGERAKLSADRLAALIKSLPRGIRPEAEMFLLGASELLGSVLHADLKDDKLRIEVSLSADGAAFLKELAEHGPVPIWFRPTPIGLLGASLSRPDESPHQPPPEPAEGVNDPMSRTHHTRKPRKRANPQPSKRRGEPFGTKDRRPEPQPAAAALAEGIDDAVGRPASACGACNGTGYVCSECRHADGDCVCDGGPTLERCSECFA